MKLIDITEAIFQKYKDSMTLKQALSLGLYYQQAPQENPFPYCVFYLNGITQEEIMGTPDCNLYDIEIQFNIYSDSFDNGDELSVLYEKLTEAFDWTTLNVSGWNCIKMQRDTVAPILFVDEIWQTTINYELGLQKE